MTYEAIASTYGVVHKSRSRSPPTIVARPIALLYTSYRPPGDLEPTECRTHLQPRGIVGSRPREAPYGSDFRLTWPPGPPWTNRRRCVLRLRPTHRTYQNKPWEGSVFHSRFARPEMPLQASPRLGLALGTCLADSFAIRDRKGNFRVDHPGIESNYLRDA